MTMSKLVKRRFFRNFILLITILTVTLGSIMSVSAAIDYNKLPYGIVRRMERASVVNNAIRKAEYSVLVELGKFVDYVKDAVDTIADLNVYNLIKGLGSVQNKTIYPIAWVALSLMLVIGAIYLMMHPDKTKISDFLRNIAFAIVLIVCLPSCISALQDLRTAGLNEVEGINISSTQKIKQSLGETVVGSNIVVINLDYENDSKIKNMSNDEKIVNYYRYHNYLPKSTSSVYSLNINGYASTKLFNKYVTSAQPAKPVEEIDVARMFELLGYKKEWNEYCKMGKNDQITLRDITITSGAANSPTAGMATYDKDHYRFYLVRLLMRKAPSITTRTSILAAAMGFINIGDDNENRYSNPEIINKNAEYRADRLFTYILDILKPYLNTLNDAANGRTTLTADSTVGQYDVVNLKTAEDYEEMGELEKLFHLDEKFLYGEDEHIYAYAIDFLPAIITLVTLIICLIFAGFKLAALIYDIAFMQLIAPIVIATDLHGAGRTKKILQELLNVYLIFIIVMLDLKIYIMALNSIFANQNLSIIVKIFLVLGGMKFCIDGPDIITKILGVDAGVKSGYGTIMGVQAAARMATGAGRIVSKGAKTGGGLVGGAIAGTVSGGVNAARTAHQNGFNPVRTVANTVGGATAGGVGGAVTGGAGGIRGQGIISSSRSGASTGGSAGRVVGRIGGRSASSSVSNSTQSNTATTSSVGADTSTANVPTSDNGGGAPMDSGSGGSSSDGGASDSSAPRPSDGSTPIIIEGQKGDKGDKGDRGDRGTEGTRGNDGADGKDGNNSDSSNNAVSPSARSSGGSSRAGGAFKNSSAGGSASSSTSSSSGGGSYSRSTSSAPSSSSARQTTLNDTPVNESSHNTMKQAEIKQESETPIREMLENSRNKNKE